MHATLVLLGLFLFQISSFAFELSGNGFCDIEGDSSACASACTMLHGQNGICVYDSCYCTDVEVGSCSDDDDHEDCNTICQDMSSNLVGVCMQGQCSCLS
ncbi:hypothetical protein BJV82DRAFT_83143 [Fennellomyces sp. T-0311]|nr:hypothetical protein BJV82DRAFT_83143 [Fennellomyces sp. T-0311]